MYKITFISTIHKEIGKCNADELCSILNQIQPEVIFLEALDNTYSNYEKLLFSSFYQFHNKLEIKAIQKYSLNNSCKYVPVLDKSLSESFDRKNEIVCANIDFQTLINKSNSLISELGFKYLNSDESIDLEEEMRFLGNQILNNKEMEQAVNLDINLYENSMIKNIYLYCKNNSFNSAVFMCGVGHRKSIIEKIKKYNIQEKMDFNWIVY
jgi:hypothetical protein